MSANHEMLIVRDVVRAFLPQGCKDFSQELLEPVLAFAEGSVNKATARCELRKAVARTEWRLDDERFDLCIETASALVCGYRHWIQGQTDIEFYPAWEFSQVFQRDEAIDWKETWLQNGGRLSPLDKMIALKSDPIGVRISMFHLPFPPFDLDSGMRVDGAHRTDAEELGLLAPYHQPQPGSLNVDFEEALRKRVEWYLATLPASKDLNGKFIAQMQTSCCVWQRSV